MEAQPADRIVVEFARRRARQRSLVLVVLPILFSLGVLWALSSRRGPWAVGLVVAMAAVVVAATAIFLITWRCPACGKSPGPVTRGQNYCGRCGIPLAEGVSSRARQTPERAEWVVATIRRRCWLVYGTFVLALGGGGLLGWLFVRADMRPLGGGAIGLGVIGWAIVIGRVWRCPECKASLSPEPGHFCRQCGVPHGRKGLERVRAGP
jgi:hypothetical protein